MTASKFKIQYLPLSDIHTYDNNPRINQEAVGKVANSIERFGFLVPIVVDGNGIIVAGHTRYMAAKQLGLDKVPVVQAGHLTEAQAAAFRVVDNKTAELAEWDFEKLQAEVDNILQAEEILLTDFGFTEDELDAILAVEDSKDAFDEEPVKTKTVAAETRTVKVSVGDVTFYIDKEEYGRWMNEVESKANFDKDGIRSHIAYDLLGFQEQETLGAKRA